MKLVKFYGSIFKFKSFGLLSLTIIISFLSSYLIRVTDCFQQKQSLRSFFPSSSFPIDSHRLDVGSDQNEEIEFPGTYEVNSPLTVSDFSRGSSQSQTQYNQGSSSQETYEPGQIWPSSKKKSNIILKRPSSKQIVNFSPPTFKMTSVIRGRKIREKRSTNQYWQPFPYQSYYYSRQPESYPLFSSDQAQRRQYYASPPPPPSYSKPSYPPPYNQNGYEEEEDDDDDNCQYHTLLNGDSEVILRKILPIRLIGRTIVRHCVKPIPPPGDPRYKVLLQGNNKSSYGTLRVTLKQR